MALKKDINIKRLVLIAVLGAISAIIMTFEFPLVFIAPNFYKLDLSETVVLMGGFAIGPWATVVIELIKILLNLIINGTTTGFVGEFANFAVGVAFTFTAALIYKYKKNIGGAILSLSVGTAVLGVAGVFLNYYVMIPFYTRFMPIEAIVAAGKSIIPAVDGLWGFVWMCVFPFNLLKGIFCSVLCFLLYKRLSKILHI